MVTTDDSKPSEELDVEDETPFVSKRTTMSEDAFADFVVPASSHVVNSSSKSSRSSRK